jgi:1,4-dihydroxy-6-naphthoate synthase
MTLREARTARTSPRELVNRTLNVAHTPDSDDAFNFYAWEHGRIDVGNLRTVFRREHISQLNHAAAAGLHDVVAISSVMYPGVADRYWILATGNSIGRGYGPVLASRRFDSCEQLHGRRIGVAEITTTGGVLALLYCSGAELIPMRYDQIADAVARGELDAGVMIHEELLYFPEKGLHKVCDLGKTWCDDTGLPLPVGLSLVRQSVGRALAQRIVRACRDSLLWAQENYDEAFAYASRFGRGCAADHVAMFSNSDTLCLPGDARRAIRLMCRRVADLGLGPMVDVPQIIDA